MKQLFFLLIPAVMLASSCGSGGNKGGSKAADLDKMKKERADLDAKIKAMEGPASDTSRKATPVTVQAVQPAPFTASVNVQAQITGDDNILATPKAPGTVKSISVHIGQHVAKGQVLATLDATTVEQQIATMQPTLTLQKSLYEKYQALWKQNVGTEFQLLTYKAQYESTQKQIAAMQSQRDLYRIVAPISGTVDELTLKVGDYAAPGMTGIKVVSSSALKAQANLGENYLGNVKQGNPVTLVFPGLNDSISTHLTYVADAIDQSSRAFTVQVLLGNNGKLHPNMSCIMKIANYSNGSVITVPVSVIQKTGKGQVVYIADGNTAKAALVQVGHISEGQAEILSGLSAGDKIITSGFEDLNDGDLVSAQK